jgi:DNA-binding PucR family transcriptional regulator
MNPSKDTPSDSEIRVRAQLSSLCGLFVLAMMMADRADETEIMRLAVSSVGSLAPCTGLAAYLKQQDGLTPIEDLGPPPQDVDKAVRALDEEEEEGPITVADYAWCWALRLQSLDGCCGYLVIGAAGEPSPDQQFLLNVLARQTGAAIANAALIRRERDTAEELLTVNNRQSRLNDELSSTVATLMQQTRIHEVLTNVAASGSGEDGIAQAVHELSNLPVLVEDRFGNLRAWAGPGQPAKHRKPTQREREDLLVRVARHGRPLREKDRVVALAQSRSDVLGVMSLIDPERTVGQQELFALEHGVTVLTTELAHRRSVTEVELRLRRELVDDLVSGTDGDSAQARAEVLGHDLVGPHQVAVMKWRGRVGDEVLMHAVQRSISNLDLRGLVARRSGQIVLIAPDKLSGPELHAEIGRVLKSTSGSIGVGGTAVAPDEYPRSFREAVRALEIRQRSRNPSGATTFQELGIYRILTVGDNNADIEGFVREWLGQLLDYDAERHADLVETLHQYFEYGGNYDATAEALLIHRSTLRYRLQRIREVSGFDLTDVDIRLNLHVATRAWKVLDGG